MISIPRLAAGALVLTADGLTAVEGMAETEGYDGEVYVVTGMCCRDLRCTDGTQLLVRRRRRVGHEWRRVFDRPEWVGVADLTKDCYLGMAIDGHSELPRWEGATDNRWGHGRTVNEVSGLMERGEFWYLMGRYVGDGWRRWDDTHKAVIICCADRDKDRQPIVDNMRSLGLHFVENRERTTRRIAVNSRELAEFVTRYGYRADGKRIDGGTLRLPVGLLRCFIDGYMDADGYYDERMQHQRCTTTSRELAYGMAQCVAKAYGTAPKLYFTRRRPKVSIEGRVCNQRDQWCVHYKTDVRPQDKAFVEDGYVWYPVNSISRERVSGLPVCRLAAGEYTVNNAMVRV